VSTTTKVSVCLTKESEATDVLEVRMAPKTLAVMRDIVRRSDEIPFGPKDLREFVARAFRDAFEGYRELEASIAPKERRVFPRGDDR